MNEGKDGQTQCTCTCIGTDYTVQQRSTDQLHTHLLSPLHTYTCKELLIEHMQTAFLSYTFSGSVYNYTHMIHSVLQRGRRPLGFYCSAVMTELHTLLLWR